MAGPGSRFVTPIAFFVDVNGVPRDGAKLNFYQTGTNTRQATYSDSALTVANTNPVICDEAGQAGNIFLLSSPNYKVVLTDANDVEVWTADPVGPSLSSAVSGEVQVGGLLPWLAAAAPTGWLLAYGQTVSRTTYAALYAVIGTTFGAGNGTTTYTLPDLRGRLIAGKDDMGGAAANRLTAAGSGVNGLTLGAVGGNELSQTHNHSLTDPGHDHALTDPGHNHTVTTYAVNQYNVPPQFILGTNSSAPHDTNATGLTAATTGITLASASTGITITDFGTGNSENVQPTIVLNWIIFTGVP